MTYILIRPLFFKQGFQHLALLSTFFREGMVSGQNVFLPCSIICQSGKYQILLEWEVSNIITNNSLATIPKVALRHNTTVYISLRLQQQLKLFKEGHTKSWSFFLSDMMKLLMTGTQITCSQPHYWIHDLHLEFGQLNRHTQLHLLQLCNETQIQQAPT